MVLDSSAIVAIFMNEPECAFFQSQILAAETRLISAVSIVETGMVLEARLGATALGSLERYLSRLAVEVVAVDENLAWSALAAWRIYGRGRHPARLNFGDCFSYALSQSTGEPLLAKGEDFVRTGLELCPQAPPAQ
ncbi:MAG TPA: type II toxin-antitoxin system VapC family toxin [Acidobacteriaceae bacterium]|jgi:ribonuclease VapC|nr:type II toxin-antitoxin system VapC family toxin [Acidobacteriaceae bacterium]